jgi:hypothetical protein
MPRRLPSSRSPARPTSSVFPKVDTDRYVVELAHSTLTLDTLVDRAQRRSALAELAIQVLEHLSSEEGPDGLHTELGNAEPRLLPRIAELRREHDAIRVIAIFNVAPALKQKYQDALVSALVRLCRDLDAGALVVGEGAHATLGATTSRLTRLAPCVLWVARDGYS